MLAVALAQGRLGSPVRPGSAQQRVAGVQVQGAASFAAVHRLRSGQVRQAAPKITARRAVIRRVIPAGQVTVPAASSTVKSSAANPPSTAGLSGPGLMTSGVRLR